MMNNTINNKIYFGAGYGDPYRTRAKKKEDFAKIDRELEKFNAINKQLEAQISSLKQDLIYEVLAYQNANDLDKTLIKAKMENIRAEIAEIESLIEKNKSNAVELWYGYHERL